jgi:hypothetical protein
VTNKIQRFVGIYNAEGNTWGEIKYAWGKLRSNTTCSLCDITHQGLKENKDWQECRDQLSVPFDVLHLDERTEALVSLTDGQVPCVLAEVDDAWTIVLNPRQLKGFEGRPDQLAQALTKILLQYET